MEGSEIRNDSKKTEAAAKTDKQKGGFFKALKAEFHRVIWPEKDSVIKETTAVVVVTVLLGVVIALLDFVIRFGIDKIVQIG